MPNGRSSRMMAILRQQRTNIAPARRRAAAARRQTQWPTRRMHRVPGARMGEAPARPVMPALMKRRSCTRKVDAHALSQYLAVDCHHGAASGVRRILAESHNTSFERQVVDAVGALDQYADAAWARRRQTAIDRIPFLKNGADDTAECEWRSPDRPPANVAVRSRAEQGGTGRKPAV